MIAFFLTMPISSTMPMTPMMSSPAPAALSVNSAPMPADGSVGQDRDRVDEALVEHAEHDIHGHDRRREQEHLVRERRSETPAPRPGS